MEKKSIVSIGTYGQIQNKVNRYYFLQGLDEMIKELESKVVLVYGKLPDELKDKVKLPKNDAQLKHIFRDEEGHLKDTPENRKMLLDLANDENYHVGKDMWGCEWHVRSNEDGTQDYTSEFNLIIIEGGKNEIPRPWDEMTGLKYNPAREERKK